MKRRPPLKTRTSTTGKSLNAITASPRSIKDLFWQETVDYPHTNPNWYSDALDPDVYVSRPYAPLEQRIKSYTDVCQKRARRTHPDKGDAQTARWPKNLIKIGRQTIGGLADFYEKDVVKVFEPVKDEASQKEFTEANDGPMQSGEGF